MKRLPTNYWWFRWVHSRTPNHKRNLTLVDHIINTPPADVTETRFVYTRGVMKGCGCNILA